MSTAFYAAEATHLVGGYMNYEYLDRESNGNYRFMLSFNVYRDCLNSDVQLDDFISVGIYLDEPGNRLHKSVNIGLVTKDNVEPPGSVDCDYYRRNVCIEYGYYEGIISLPASPFGYHLSFARCCRNEQNNLVQGNQPTQGQTYYCNIPGTAFENSSPSFYGVPSPYMCVNDTNSFLFDAIDKDGDSLVYQFMRPYDGASTGDPVPDPPATLETPLVRYKPGYTELQPFGATGFMDIDPTTGHTRLLSRQTGNFVVGVEVLEYRNQELLSRVRLDLQIIVLDCIPNDIPDIGSSEGKRFTIEEGEELCFDVNASDPDGDLVKLYGRGVLLGDGDTAGIMQATFIDTFGQPYVTSKFCWTPGCDMARNNPYLVYFTAEDDGCPPKFNNLDVEIRVTPFVGASNLIGPISVCRFNEYDYEVTDGGNESTFEWDISQGVIVGSDTGAQVTIDWSGTGTGLVRVREVSKASCIGDWLSLNVNIRESPPIPVISGIDTVCLNEVRLQYSVIDNLSFTFNWETINASIGVRNQNLIELLSYGTPDFSVLLSATNSFGCTSDTAELLVHVSEPLPTIIGPISICPNAVDVAYSSSLETGSVYTWSVIGGVQTSGGSTSDILITWGDEGLGQVFVTETNRHGCVSPIVSLGVNKTYDLQNNPIAGPVDICEFELDIVYSVTDINGSVYDWFVQGGLQSIGDSSHSIGVDWGAAGNARVSVVQRAYDAVNGRACLSDTQRLDVMIHPIPTASEILGTMKVCQLSDTFIYSIAGFANSTYEWTINGNAQNIIGQGTNEIKIFWQLAGTFTLAVEEISQFLCTGLVVDTLVLVNPKPTTTPISGPAIICPEDPDGHIYSVVGFPMSTYDWNVIGEINFTGNSTSSITVDWDISQPFGTVSVLETSDKGCLGDAQTLRVEIDRLAIDLRFVSVGTPDDRMIINWQLEVPAATSSFDIQKRESGTAGAWQNVGTVDGNVFEFTETPLNTDVIAFEYRVSAVNKCGTQIISEVHTNILLKGIQDEDFNSLLNFSNYLGWDNGVLDYTVYGNDNRNPYSLKEAGVIPGRSVLVVNNPDQYRKCFRVRALELDGELTTSLSNEVCFYYSPEVYVPNAFSANGDNLNDGFGVKGVAINEFNIQIFNRWGEKLYESDDIDEKWIPIYRYKDIQMGTYIYVIRYSDFENKVFQKTGTINLLR